VGQYQLRSHIAYSLGEQMWSQRRNLTGRALDLPLQTLSTFFDTVAAIILEEHALKAVFLRLTGPAMIKVVDGALGLALPLLDQMATQGITYEELANRQIAGSK
jgi:hypothetical protein